MKQTNDQWHHDFVDLEDIKLHYVTQGEGPLMLMLHGFPEFWYSWRHQIPEFAQDHHVVALDLRGYNDSDKPQGVSSYQMKLLVNDVVKVIQALGYEKCILVGHDWGAVISWFVAENYPQMIEKLIIMNVPHPAKFVEGLKTIRQLLRSWYMLFFQIPRLPEWLISRNNFDLVGKAFSGTAIDKTAFTEEDLAAYREAAAKPGAITAMINYYRNMFSGLRGSEQSWSVLPMPTLMIWGEDDTALGKELTYGTDDYVEQFTLHYIPNCSHWVQQEQPKKVNQYMREFLDEQ